MATDLNALHDERAKCVADADKIVKRCEAAGGKWAAEDQAEFDKLHGRAADLYGQIQAEKGNRDRAARSAEAVASLAESRGRRSAPTEPAATATAGPPVVTLNGHALRFPVGSAIARRAAAEYVEAFGAYIGTGGVQASLQTDVADVGGYLAPPQFVADLIQELNNSFWLRRLARVLPPTTAPKVTMPRRSSRINSFVWGSELAPPTADTGYRLGTYNLTPHYMTGEVEVSNDLLAAASISPETIVRGEMTFRSGELEEQAFMLGDGDGKPLGVYVPSTDGIPASRDVSGDPTAYDAWVDVQLSLREPYLRSEALRWLLHRNAFKILSKMKTSYGEPLWIVSTRDGQPDRLLGKPVVMSEYAPAGSTLTNGIPTGYASGDYVGLLGDFSQYDILDGLDFGVARMTDSYYQRRNMTGFINRRKVDGCPRIGEAFARFKKA